MEWVLFGVIVILCVTIVSFVWLLTFFIRDYNEQNRRFMKAWLSKNIHDLDHIDLVEDALHNKKDNDSKLEEYVPIEQAMQDDTLFEKMSEEGFKLENYGR